MKAIRFHQYGDPEVLRYEDVPDPQPRKDQVLVKVKACALNHLDLWVRRGTGKVPLPHIPGSDVSGEIVSVGDYVQHLRPGQRVLLAPMVYCGHCARCVAGKQNSCPDFTVLGNRVDGGDCEFLAADPQNVFPIPDSMTYDEAAAVPLVFLTAWHMLTGRCRIKPGDTVLVLAAGSGIGSAAIQICRLFNCKVIATAGDQRKLEKARELGAQYVIDHYTQSISEEVKKITAKAGVDVVFEHVGQATWEESLKSLKPGGCLVTCGATTGAEARIDLRFVYSRQFSILGSYMGDMGELHAVLSHIFAGRLKPVIDKTFPMRDARAAHQRLEHKEQFGKVILNPEG